MAETLSNWDFTQKHVNQNNLVSDGFASAESIVLVSGPATVDSTFDPANLNTIGVVESAAISQNKQIQQFFEIGSKLPFNVPGRTNISISLSRIMFDGNSLMAALSPASEEVTLSGNDSPGYATAGGNATASTDNFFLNLASTYFNNPIGLGMILHDNQDEALAMVYLEECLIRSHQMSIGAGQTIIMENVNIVATNIQPIDYGSRE